MDAWIEGSIDPSVRKLIYQNAFYNHRTSPTNQSQIKIDIKTSNSMKSADTHSYTILRASEVTTLRHYINFIIIFSTLGSIDPEG